MTNPMNPDPSLSEGDLLPCPFCGGAAERIDIDEGENAGGSCISCTVCQASSNVEFEFKENFVSNWNRRALLPAAQPAPALDEGDRELVEGLRAGIYVASRASAPERPAMWRRLRDAGHPIISTWIDEAGEGQTASNRELWQRIQREVMSAERLVFYAETADFPLKGAYIEVGMALAARVPVFVVIPDVILEPRSLRPLGSWAMHPLVSICSTVEEAFAAALPRLLSLATRPGEVPVGWKLVPVEPTKEQLYAAGLFGGQTIKGRYIAMVAHAPAAPAPEGGRGGQS